MSRLSTGTMRGCRARAACSHARSNLMHTYTNTHPHYSRLPSSPSKRPQARSCGFVTRRRERSWASCRTVVVVAAAPVGIFYSTGTGSTKRIANSIKVQLGELADVPVPINATSARDFEGYKAIVFGAPSYLWEKHRVSALDFDTIEPPFDNFKDLAGVKVAIFGLGDQKEYPKNFCDAIGILWEHFGLRGAEMVGAIENEGYDFKRSRALKQGMLVGLPLDLENQPDLVPEQVSSWVTQLKTEFDLPSDTEA